MTPRSATVRVSAKGWIVIPAPMRRRYHIAPGQEIRIVDFGGVLSLIPVAGKPVSGGRGLLAGKTSLTKALLEERRRERKREER